MEANRYARLTRACTAPDRDICLLTRDVVAELRGEHQSLTMGEPLITRRERVVANLYGSPDHGSAGGAPWPVAAPGASARQIALTTCPYKKPTLLLRRPRLPMALTAGANAIAIRLNIKLPID